jgi:hypothetical protein
MLKKFREFARWKKCSMKLVQKIKHAFFKKKYFNMKIRLKISRGGH